MKPWVEEALLILGVALFVTGLLQYLERVLP
jgi:hypothetical protein